MLAPSRTTGNGPDPPSNTTATGPATSWKVVVAVLLFAAFAPLALVAIPVAVLLASSRPRYPREFVALAVAGVIGLAWLLEAGPPPDQVLRTAAVIATAVYAVTTRLSRATWPHRAILSLGTAAAAVSALAAVVGPAWDELHWWVERQAAETARIFLRIIWATAPVDPEGVPEVSAVPVGARAQIWFADAIQIVADYYPAIVALQLGVGLAVATAIYHRLASHPFGRPVGRLSTFRFSEHVGWLAAVPLILVLVPAALPGRIAATNLLVVMGTLYAWRGLAVTVSGLSVLRAGTGFTVGVLAVAVLLLLPIAAAITILLGVLDTGLDFRRRWHSEGTEAT